MINHFAMEFQVFLVFAALLSVSMLVSVYGTESSGEAYWKMNLGSDTNMPKVVKDALLDQQLSDTKTNQANQQYASGIHAFAQQLSSVRTTGKPLYTKEAQAYAQQLSSVRTTGQPLYTKEAQAYAQQLSKVRTKEAQASNKYAKVAASLFTTGRWYSKGSELLTDNFVQYFFEKDLLYPRSTMKFHFFMGVQKAKFMSSEVANSMSFSSSKLPEILKFFAVKPGSQNAKIIEQIIILCESQAMKGEEKSCETSLEGMVNYAKSKLGKQIKAVSTEVNEETEQEYHIKSATKINNEKNLVCHKLVYPYAVFYCHTLSKADTYDVSLVNSAGKKVSAVAVCHKDTSHWDPEHLAFQHLKVKPGSVPICHFLNVDAVVWVPK